MSIIIFSISSFSMFKTSPVILTWLVLCIIIVEVEIYCCCLNNTPILVVEFKNCLILPQVSRMMPSGLDRPLTSLLEISLHHGLFQAFRYREKSKRTYYLAFLRHTPHLFFPCSLWHNICFPTNRTSRTRSSSRWMPVIHT